MRVISFVGKPQGRSMRKKVLTEEGRVLLEVALVPDNEEEPETRRKAAERLGRPAVELRLADSRSWHLRSWLTRSPSIIVMVLLALVLVSIAELVVPTLRSTGVLLSSLLLAVCGVVLLVKDQSARVIGSQLAVLVGLLATVAYAACQWAYYIYYDYLGPAPEAVGLATGAC